MGRGGPTHNATKEQVRVKRTDRTQQQPSPRPRARAIQAAADACNAHQQAPDTHTFHRLRATVQTAHNLGATWADIRAARGQQ